MEEEKKEPYDYLQNFGDKLTQGRNLNTFSSENQPANRGRKKTKHISKLIRAMGKSLAPQTILTGDLKLFLESKGWKGTYDEVCIARLYSIALTAKDSVAIKAIQQIMDSQNFSGKSVSKGIVIQFIAPPKEAEQEAPIDLSNDSWTVTPQVPGESKTDV